MPILIGYLLCAIALAVGLAILAFQVGILLHLLAGDVAAITWASLCFAVLILGLFALGAHYARHSPQQRAAAHRVV